MPEWYLDLLAANRLGVHPEELEHRSVIWRERALVAQAAENNARRQVEERAAARRERHGSGRR